MGERASERAGARMPTPNSEMATDHFLVRAELTIEVRCVNTAAERETISTLCLCRPTAKTMKFPCANHGSVPLIQNLLSLSQLLFDI